MGKGFEAPSIYSRYTPSWDFDGPNNYNNDEYVETRLSECRTEQAREHFTAVLSALYGKNDLDAEWLDFWLSEVAGALDLDMPPKRLLQERFEKLKTAV